MHERKTWTHTCMHSKSTGKQVSKHPPLELCILYYFCIIAGFWIHLLRTFILFPFDLFDATRNYFRCMSKKWTGCKVATAKESFRMEGIWRHWLLSSHLWWYWWSDQHDVNGRWWGLLKNCHSCAVWWPLLTFQLTPCHMSQRNQLVPCLKLLPSSICQLSSKHALVRASSYSLLKYLFLISPLYFWHFFWIVLYITKWSLLSFSLMC